MGQPGGVIIHDFQQRLADSQALSDEPAWVEFYHRVWPRQILAHQRIDKDSVYQRWGVDREIKLVTGQQFSIDEKKRTKDYGDFLAEEWSVWHGDRDERNRIGWTLDRSKRCDYIAYAVVPTGRCYLIPFDLLRRTAEACWAQWALHAQYPKFAENRGYKTKNCPVPWAQLWRDMQRVSDKDFVGTVALPTPFAITDQLVFQW